MSKQLLLNIILDGWGIGKSDETNAVYMANTPCMDKLLKSYPTTTIHTHGHHVGLPGEKDMGGSEVGHITIGAGRVIPQGSSLISDMINDGSFFRQQSLVSGLIRVRNENKCLHMMGLLSDGNIHSHIDHWFALIKAAKENGVQKCNFHILLDGRDVGIQSAHIYVEALEKFIVDNNLNPNDYKIVSGGGREFMTMDRALNWTKVKKGWDTHVHGKSKHIFPTALDAIKHFRNEIPNLIDQDIPDFVVAKDSETVHKISDGDLVLFVNFRGDRAIEITRAFCEVGFNEFTTEKRPNVDFLGMTRYDEDTDLPKKRLIEGAKVTEPFGKRILDRGLKQFRLAETQKFPHVTFFFNGGYREPLDSKLETYHIIPSDVVPSFAMKPEMKANEISDQAIEFITSGEFDFGLINFANPDMVGHTADFKAVVKAVETVDTALGRLLNVLEQEDGMAIVTADHGNAEEMIITNKMTGQREVSSKHSINPVPLILFTPNKKEKPQIKNRQPENPFGLSNIAATNFDLMGITDASTDLNPSVIE